MRKFQIVTGQNLTSHLQLIVIMRNVYIYCFLSVLNIVETAPLNITGHVGGNVSFECSDWNTWTSTEDNAKYLCKNPCNAKEDIMVNAESGENTTHGRITLRNSGKVLFVSITKLENSDFGIYFCGLVRRGLDSYIKVHLNVKNGSTKAPGGGSSRPAPNTTAKMTTPNTTSMMTTPITTTTMPITTSMLHHPDASTMISVVSTTTMLHKSSSSSVGTVAVLSARNPTEDDGETHANEKRGGEDQSAGLTMSPVYTTINIMPTVDTTSNIYANANDDIHQDPSDSVVYDTVVTSEERVTFNVDLHPNQDIKMPQISSLVPSVNAIPDEDLYSLAQLPKDQAIPLPQ